MRDSRGNPGVRQMSGITIRADVSLIRHSAQATAGAAPPALQALPPWVDIGSLLVGSSYCLGSVILPFTGTESWSGPTGPPQSSVICGIHVRARPACCQKSHDRTGRRRSATVTGLRPAARCPSRAAARRAVDSREFRPETVPPSRPEGNRPPVPFREGGRKSFGLNGGAEEDRTPDL